jgi:hypothetical protein
VALATKTGRAVIVYASAFLQKVGAPPHTLQIGLDDVQGFMEAASNIEERELDLILHSPGGTAEAAESIVAYLRTQFDHIRVFVPLAAMSAATMLALGADEVVMGTHSQLGPIDPQFAIQTPEGPRSAPARAILDQFERAKAECKDPRNLAAWMPILRSYAPGLLAQCKAAEDLAERMVSQWLERYMLASDPEGKDKAKRAAKWFGDYSYFRSHSRRVSYEDVDALELKVSRLEDDPSLQDAVLSVHHALVHTFSGTPALKLIENHRGRAFVEMMPSLLVAPPGQPPAPAQQPGPPVPGASPPKVAKKAKKRRR